MVTHVAAQHIAPYPKPKPNPDPDPDPGPNPDPDPDPNPNPNPNPSPNPNPGQVTDVAAQRTRHAFSQTRPYPLALVQEMARQVSRVSRTYVRKKGRKFGWGRGAWRHRAACEAMLAREARVSS